MFEDFYKGDIIQNIFEKLCYTEHEGGVQPEWATFGHQAEKIIRDYVNRKYKTNYRPAVSINEDKQSKTNVDGYDENAKEQLWECKTYSGKENIDKYMKQITYYMLRNNIDSCLLTTLSKDVVDKKGKKIRNITIEELNDDELKKRLNFHVIKFKQVKKLAEQIDMLTTEYSKLYNYIANSHLMNKFIEDYKAMMFTQNSMVENFMDSFK